jgi:hypothetical protein
LLLYYLPLFATPCLLDATLATVRPNEKAIAAAVVVEVEVEEVVAVAVGEVGEVDAVGVVVDVVVGAVVDVVVEDRARMHLPTANVCEDNHPLNHAKIIKNELPKKHQKRK